MKTKLLITTIIAGLLIPATAATAQTSTAELRRDRQDIREETRDVRQAQRTGTYAQVRDEREDLAQARREYREDRTDRRDDRYDDRRDDRADHQRHHNSRFVAPFRYQRFANGNRIANGYWAPRYRVNDVHRYRLPAPTRQQAYVRHYDDLLLVNTRNGTVLRVWRNMY